MRGRIGDPKNYSVRTNGQRGYRYGERVSGTATAGHERGRVSPVHHPGESVGGSTTRNRCKEGVWASWVERRRVSEGGNPVQRVGRVPESFRVKRTLNSLMDNCTRVRDNITAYHESGSTNTYDI